MPRNDAEFATTVYNELRRIAGASLRRERPGQTLQATALVHEAYLRLANANAAWTELRIVLALGALKAAVSPIVTLSFLGQVHLFDLGGSFAVAGLAAVFSLSAWRNTRALYQAEPLASAIAHGTDRNAAA